VLCAQELVVEDLTSFFSFIDKARKLLNSTFAKEMTGKTGVDITWKENEQVVFHRGPNDEFVDAFVLTFRFFIQDNESISFRNMSKSFESEVVNEKILEQFKEARNHLNSYLDDNTMFNVGGFISRRDLLYVFVFGELSHSNPDKKKTYDSWMSNEYMAPLMKNEFRCILNDVLKIISFVGGLSDKVVSCAKST
jgi:hypothetical protein